jgi:hypothetical protein
LTLKSIKCRDKKKESILPAQTDGCGGGRFYTEKVRLREATCDSLKRQYSEIFKNNFTFYIGCQIMTRFFEEKQNAHAIGVLG